MKQKLINMQRKIDKSTIIAVDFKILFLIIDRISRQKLNNIPPKTAK